MAKSTSRARVRKSRRPAPRLVARSKKKAKSTKKRSTTRSTMRARKTSPKTTHHPMLGAMKGTERRELGGVTLDVGRAGAGRVKRMVYPPGFEWAKDMKANVDTDLCMHAHVGFLAQGEIHVEFADGCVVECKAPQFIAIEPGHNGWVVGDEPVVLIEFDFEGETIERLGMPDAHRH